MRARRRPQLHYQLELFTVLHTARHELLVPATVIAEVGYFLAREADARVESLFPTVLADGDFAPVDLTSADYAQIADLVNTYESLPSRFRTVSAFGSSAPLRPGDHVADLAAGDVIADQVQQLAACSAACVVAAMLPYPARMTWLDAD